MTNEEMKKLMEGCAKSTMEMAKRMKEQGCRENNGKYDVPPFVVFGIKMEDDEGEMKSLGGALVEMDCSDNHPADELVPLFSAVHENGMREFVWTMFVCEGYSRRAFLNRDEMSEEEIEKAMTTKRGELEKEFAEKADTDVCEGIVATMFAWTGEALTISSFYKYGDDGMPVYEEDEIMFITPSEEEMKGAIPDKAYAFIKYCKSWLALNEVAENIDTDVVMENQPTFQTVWEVVADDYPKDLTKKVKRKMKEQVGQFVASSLFAKITKECWESISALGEKGELDIAEFMENLEQTMAGKDTKAKAELLRQMSEKYSLTANALALAVGESVVPDDISGLVS